MHFDSVETLIGNTPLLRLIGYEKRCGLGCKVSAKLEYLNPFGSVKDRAALFMLNAAEREGRIAPGGTVIEPTSGNTGIALSALCAQRGYKCIIVMPENMSPARQRIMRAYGANVVLTAASEGMTGAISAAKELLVKEKNSFMPDQFNNPANAYAHFASTGPEIWTDTSGSVSAFVAGIGTGGTIMGVARYLKSKNPAIRIIGVEPDTSAVLSGGAAGVHKLQGIGAGFVPPLIDSALIDEVLPISYEAACTAKQVALETDGVLIGISAGAALAAAKLIAMREAYAGGNIAVLFADGGERYL